MRRIGLPLVIIAAGVTLWLLLSPPRFWLNLTRRVEPTAAVGAQLVERYSCRGCHRIGGQGALIAPDLDGEARRLLSGDGTLDAWRLWLINPAAVRPGTTMPAFPLSDSQIEALLLYLQEQAQSTGS